MEKKGTRDAFRANMVQQTAAITGVSVQHVRRVINGTCENEVILGTYMELVEGSNALIARVRELVPFDN